MRCIALLALFLFATACGTRRQKPLPTIPSPSKKSGSKGFEVLPEDAREQLRKDIRLRAGTPLTDELENAAGDRAVEILQNHGHPYAQVGIVREPIDANRARVILRAEPGTRGFFGPVDIAGNRRVDDRIIRRRLAYAPGDLFRRSAIEQTQQRIGALGLFKSIQIRAHDIDNHPAVVPTLITVEEGTPWKWNLGVGYAAGERLGVDARISHLNVFGSARRVDLQGRVSSIERTVETTFTQTDAWHPALSLSLQVRHQELDQPAFFVVSRGGQAAVSWQWTKELSTTGSYAVALERSDVDASLDPLLGLEDGMLSAWSLDLDHRRMAPAASLCAPYRCTSSRRADGCRAPSTTSAPLATCALSACPGRPRGHCEPPAGWDRSIRWGAKPISRCSRDFFSAARTRCGAGCTKLSPLSASGEPVGGKSLLSATAEARMPIFKRFRAAVFIEAGNVWQDPWSMRLGDLRYDTGPGVRFDTPFGLIRFDFGYQLKPLDGLRIDGKPQTSRGRFNFGSRCVLMGASLTRFTELRERISRQESRRLGGPST